MAGYYSDDDDLAQYGVGNSIAAREAQKQQQGRRDDSYAPVAGPSRLAAAAPAAGGRGGGSTSANGVQARARQKQRQREPSIMDIDEVIAGMEAGSAFPLGSNHPQDEVDETIVESNIQRLMRHWMDERHAPELLHYQGELIDRLMMHLESQAEAVELINSTATHHSEEHERILLVSLEIERLKYLIKAYLRTRTYKLEMFAQYLLKTPGARGKMSDIEHGYIERYWDLIEKHLKTSVTDTIPERLGRLDEEEMIIKPDLDTAVFAKARRTCPEITMPDGAPLNMQKGDIHMLRYRSIRRLLRDGDVTLV